VVEVDVVEVEEDQEVAVVVEDSVDEVAAVVLLEVVASVQEAADEVASEEDVAAAPVAVAVEVLEVEDEL
jgi:hypothetical protein